MFCPKCGNPDQTPESYCRQCGIFLPDLSKPARMETPPETHFRANIVLSSMTIVACTTLSILLWTMLAFRPDTPTLIYVTAGLLFAMAIWHIQTLYRTLQLRKHFKKTKATRELRAAPDAETARLLDEADMSNVVPASVTEYTTKHLSETKVRSS